MKFGQESLGPTVCKREMAILWGVHMKRLSDCKLLFYMTSNQTNNYEDELV